MKVSFAFGHMKPSVSSKTGKESLGSLIVFFCLAFWGPVRSCARLAHPCRIGQRGSGDSLADFGVDHSHLQFLFSWDAPVFAAAV